MSDAIWIALALVLVIEGIGPLLFPNRWQRYLHSLAEQPTNQVQGLGGALVCMGLISLYFLL